MPERTCCGASASWPSGSIPTPANGCPNQAVRSDFQPPGASSMQTVIGAFDNRAQAQQAQERLVRDGFDRDDVCIEPNESTTTTTTTGAAPRGDQDRNEPQGRIGRFFAELFGTSDVHRHHSETYQEAVRRGGYVVVVDAEDDAQAEQAAMCLHEAGAIN